MGFKHIILVGCDCTDNYEVVIKLWKEAFIKVDELYPDVNIFIYSPANLKLKPTFNLLNLMILKKEKNKYFLNKNLFDLLFKNNNWEFFTFENLIFKPYNNELVYFESNEIINTNIIILPHKSVLKYLFNFNLKKVSELFINNTITNIFEKNNIILSRDLYKKNSKNNKLVLINENIYHENVINININFNENTLVIHNNYIKQTIILGKILYFLKYYSIKININNVVDILLISLRYQILFNILSTRQLCCEFLIDEIFFFKNKDVNKSIIKESLENKQEYDEPYIEDEFEDMPEDDEPYIEDEFEDMPEDDEPYIEDE